MTKKLTFKIKGKGKPGDGGWAVGESIYVRYYSDDFKENFEKEKDKIDEDFDFETFLTNHEEKCIWLGRGIDLGNFNYSIEVFENDKPVKLSSDIIYEISEENIGSDSYDDALKEYHALENIDLNYIIRARYANGEEYYAKIFDTDEFFKNTKNFKFADILFSYCKEVTAHTTIEVDDNYSLRDFNINIGYLDTYPDQPTQFIYEKTKLELPVYSIDYKGKTHNLNFDVKTGGIGERTFYERKIKKEKYIPSEDDFAASSDTKDEKIIETEEWDNISELQSAWDSGRLV